MEFSSSLLSSFSQLHINPEPSTHFSELMLPRPSFFSNSTSQELGNDMRQECNREVNTYEEVVSTEGEDNQDNEDSTVDLYVRPSDFENTDGNPYIATFVYELENTGHVVESFQKIYYFNGANSYAVPHHGNRVQPASQNIAYILEWWLAEKFSHTGNIPILEDTPQISAESIMFKLREVATTLNGLAKVLINIRAGHVYSLHMVGDEIVIPPKCKSFFQNFPLFVSLSIKVQAHLPSARHNECQVLVAVEHMTMNDQTTSGEMRGVPCRFSHHRPYDSYTTTTRVSSSPDGQLFCLLEDMTTNLNGIW